MKSKKKKQIVMVEVEDGALRATKIPKGVALVVIDFDTDGAEDADLCTCAHGGGRRHFHREETVS